MTELAMPSITVRLAGPDDVLHLASLFQAMFADWGAEPPVTESEMTLKLKEAVATTTPQFEILVAVIDSKLVGFAAFGEVYEPAFMGTGGFLRDVFVLPACRRQGAGAELIRQLLIEAGRRHWVSLDWHVNRLDFEARTFFEMVVPDGYNVDRLVHRIEGETLTKQVQTAIGSIG